jgi:hypothetical protein
MRSALPAAENGSAAKSSAQTPLDQSAPVRPKRARTAVKQEAEEINLRLPDNSEKQAEAQGKSTRTTRQRRKPRPSETAKDEGALVASVQAPAPASSSMIRSVGPDASDLSSASILPASNHHKVNTPITPKASVTITQSTQSATPTLKIRLPRLSAVSAAVHSNAAPPVTVHSAASSKEPRPKRPLRRQTSDTATVSLSGTSSSATDGGDEFEPSKPKRERPPKRIRG